MTALEKRIQAALAAVGEECRWELIDGIVGECPDDVLAAGLRLLRDERRGLRTLGADILGRLVVVDPGAEPAVVAALLDCLAGEAEPRVVASAVAALGRAANPRHCPRWRPGGPWRPGRPARVAFAVATIAPVPLPEDARRALIRLSGDAESEVRDWATFGLGTLSGDDGPDVRAALLARAHDPVGRPGPRRSSGWPSAATRARCRT